MLDRDNDLINDFGNEWSKFNQKGISKNKNLEIFNNYFSIFPWQKINNNSIGMDVGSGSGRWAYFVAKKVKKLYLIEPSLKALNVSRDNLSSFKNIEFYNVDANNIKVEDSSLDFCYSLGVLHHIPNMNEAIHNINLKLKKGAPFLLYIYYSFENKPFWFKFIWKISDCFRLFISSLPFYFKSFLCDIIALFVYFPLSRFSLIVKKLGFDIKNIPLSFYHNQNFYVLRNDALDRFGTKVEQRLSKNEIKEMLNSNNFTNISFSEKEPYWCVICYKEKTSK